DHWRRPRRHAWHRGREHRVAGRARGAPHVAYGRHWRGRQQRPAGRPVHAHHRRAWPRRTTRRHQDSARCDYVRAVRAWRPDRGPDRPKRLDRLERLAAGEAGAYFVPETDLEGLATPPAQVHDTVVAHAREVDQSGAYVAYHDAH